MNTEELKKEFANHLQVKELDTREGYAVEWTVAAMSNEVMQGDEIEKLAENFGASKTSGNPTVLDKHSLKVGFKAGCTASIEQYKEIACDFFWENMFHSKPGVDKKEGYQSIRVLFDKWLSENSYHKNKLAATQPDKSNEAIAFAEWANKHYYTVLEDDEWYSRTDNECYKTPELYKLFSPNEAGERKFTLDEMLTAINHFHGAMVKGRRGGAEEYFIKTFGIDLGERK